MYVYMYIYIYYMYTYVYIYMSPYTTVLLLALSEHGPGENGPDSLCSVHSGPVLLENRAQVTTVVLIMSHQEVNLS